MLQCLGSVGTVIKNTVFIKHCWISVDESCWGSIFNTVCCTAVRTVFRTVLSHCRVKVQTVFISVLWWKYFKSVLSVFHTSDLTVYRVCLRLLFVCAGSIPSRDILRSIVVLQQTVVKALIFSLFKQRSIFLSAWVRRPLEVFCWIQ